MARISKEKQQQIAVTVIFTVLILVAIWFFLAKTQLESSKKTDAKIAKQQKQLDAARKLLSQKDQKEAATEEARQRLEKIENGMASGDLSSWGNYLITSFGKARGVEVLQIPTPGTKPTEMFPDFPYQTANYTVQARGFYHDIGKFVADFENTYKYKRLQNLEMVPVVGLTGADAEKLAFTFDMISLIKPSAQ